MVRKHKRKTDHHGQTPEAIMQQAVNLVIEGMSIRTAAAEYEISKSTLQRYVNKTKVNGDNVRMKPLYDHQRIFSDTEEIELVDYLVTASKLHHGLTTKATRTLAYNYAVSNDKTIPSSWKENQIAGLDWLHGFMKRNNNLAIRTPEATSLSRATSFNKKNVGEFFENLEDVMRRKGFKQEHIYNADETGLTTVQKPPKVIAEKGAKQVGQVTSAERGQLVTMNGAINALGNAIPPFFIFPRVNFKDFMIKGAPPGTKGVAYHTGWMTKESYLVWLDHFIEHSKCSKENPVLLITDNHESHISIEAIDKAKANGITVLTLPPHCSHKMQPLDRTVYGPLKRYYNAACDSWQLQNPGKTISIYEVAEMAGKSYPRAFTPENIISGFKVTGICPFDRHIFQDDEYLPASVTDRPDPTAEGTADVVPDAEAVAGMVPREIVDDVPVSGEDVMPVPNTSSEPTVSTQTHSASDTNDSGHMSPSDIRPYPKAGPRKSKVPRKRKKTLILTDTPVRNQLEEIQNLRKKRKIPSKSRSATKMIRPQTIDKKKKVESSDSDSDGESVKYKESDSDSDIVNLRDEVPVCTNFTAQDLNEGDFLLVKYDTKMARKYYVGKFQNYLPESLTYEITFLARQHTKTQTVQFIYPSKVDIDDVEFEDIIMRLPEPTPVGGTERAKKQFKFEIDLSTYF